MFLPIFFLEGRAAVNRGTVSLERDPFAVMLLRAEYQPDHGQASLVDVAAFEAAGDGYPEGGVDLPAMKVTVDPAASTIRWGAGTPPTVFESVTIPDFGWAVGYCRKGGELIFYGRLGEQNVSGADVTLAWHEQGIGIERVKD